MDVTIENLTELTRKITVTLPESDVKNKLKKAYDKLTHYIQIEIAKPNGQVCSTIIKNYQPQVEAEVGDELVQGSYFDAIEKESIDPVVHPEISEPSFKDDGSFSYVAMVDIKPEFELTDYKGIEIEKPDVNVSDEEIDSEIDTMSREIAPLKTVGDRGIENDDIVIVDFQGFHNGKAMKEVQNDDYSVEVGSGQIGVEFEEKLLGMKSDEAADHEVSFPEKYPNPVLAGKTVEFKVKIKDVKERVLPEIDDEFAQDVSEDCKTLDDLKSAIRDTKQTEKDEKSQGELSDRIMQKMLEKNDFEVPVRLVRFEVEGMIKNTIQVLEQRGMDLESAGLNREELAEQNKETAEKRVRGDFILKKIAELEDIKVNDEDMDRGFKRIGDQYNMPVAKVKEFFANRDDLLPLMNELLNEKILEFLRSEAVLMDSPIPETAPVVEEKTTE